MTKKLSSISNNTNTLLDNSQHNIQDKKIKRCTQNYCFSGIDLRLKNNDDSFYRDQEEI